MYVWIPLREEDVHQWHTAILAAAEQSVRRLVQEDAVDGIRVSLMCGGGFFMLEVTTFDH